MTRHPGTLARRLTMFTALAVVLGGCAHTGVNLPTPAPTGLKCYQGLPAASAVLNEPDPKAYRFVGLKLTDAEEILRHFPQVVVLRQEPTMAVCAYAFLGHFRAGQVDDAPRKESGDAALVIFTPDRQLLGAAVLARLPVRFTDLTHA